MILVIDFLFSVAMFINAMLFVPQIIKIIKAKNAKGVSVLTFGGFNLIQIVVMLHGYFHHDMYLFLGTIPSILTCGTVTGLIIYYNSKELLRSKM